MKKKVNAIDQVAKRTTFIMRALACDETKFARKLGVSKPAIVGVTANKLDPSQYI